MSARLALPSILKIDFTKMIVFLLVARTGAYVIDKKTTIFVIYAATEMN